MNISLNKLNNCNDLDKSTIHEMANKLKINYTKIENESDSYKESTEKICALIKKNTIK